MEKPKPVKTFMGKFDSKTQLQGKESKITNLYPKQAQLNPHPSVITTNPLGFTHSTTIPFSITIKIYLIPKRILINILKLPSILEMN